MHRLIVKAGVVVDAILVGGGFPSRYTDSEPAPLSSFIDVIKAGMETMPVTEHCRLICEPGRALVAAPRAGRVPPAFGPDHPLAWMCKTCHVAAVCRELERDEKGSQE